MSINERRQRVEVVSSGPVALTVGGFYELLKQNGVKRAYILFRSSKFESSHPELLAPIVEFLRSSKDFAGHEAIFIGREEGIDTLFFAFIHCTSRGLAQGGLRFKSYSDLDALLRDGLRLARGMTRKNALARLWWGGGKGIMPLPLDSNHELTNQERRKYFEAYGRFVASLNGLYYTAEDMGTSPADMEAVHCFNRFTTCIPKEIGGSGNPSEFTALGVFNAMRAAWKVIAGAENLKAVRVAVQGVGHVGLPLVKLLLESQANVWVADTPEKLRELTQLGLLPARVNLVAAPESIYDLDVDVFSPCWQGAVINSRTIPRLKARLVCGAANNILREPEDADRLRARAIEYVPDFVCNRMGIVNCADEWMGYIPEDVRQASSNVFADTIAIFARARQLNITTARAADQLADAAARESNPLFGNRASRILQYLVMSDWAKVDELVLSAA